jgi:drug/metabolite transporter (DMT)-like permease
MSADPDISKQPPTWAIAAAFAIVYLSWGTTYYATGIAMKAEHMPPALFAGVRVCIAGSILLIIQFFRGQHLRLTGGDFLRVLLMSACYFLCGNLLVNIGQQQVPSGVTAVLIATTPLWIGLFGICVPGGERLSWRGWTGLALGIPGILLVKAAELEDGIDLLNDFYPLLVLASAASWAIGSLVSRHMVVNVSHLTSAGWQMLFGGIGQVVIGTCFGEWHDLPDQFNQRVIITFFYLLVVGSLMGFVAFNWLLGHVSAAKVGTYAYVNPVIAVLVGWCANETEVHAALLAGIAVILAGVYLVRGDRVASAEIELEPD